MKKDRWLLLLSGCMLSGCVNGPLPEKAAWPWEDGHGQAENYFSIRGNVANFDAPPTAVKPVSTESPETRSPETNPAPEAAAMKTQPSALPVLSQTGSDKIHDNLKREYDFTVRDIKTAPPSYLPMDSVRTGHDITAFNHGNAPVSVTVGIAPQLSQNLATDRTLPLTAVIRPNSEQALVRVGPKIRSENYTFRYTYSWSIGDYAARHNCPEHYRFPFGDNVKAFASVSDGDTASAYTRHAVLFSMPAGTPVLVARKGRVVQIKTDRVDVLHDDSTIATYGHLGRISEGVTVGKAVSTDDAIGVVGTTADKKEGYVQLAVWRPEPLPVTSLKAVSQIEGFDFVSFPLQFCGTDPGDCRVVRSSQMVSRTRMTGAGKQGKRKVKAKSI